MAEDFLGASHASSREDSLFVVLPAPYDATASYGTGARCGPSRIIEASRQLELFDEELLIEPWKAGIFTEEPLELPVAPEGAAEIIEEAVLEIFRQEKIPVLLGGDHSVATGSIRAASKYFGKIDILQLDAHADLRDEYQGTGFSHACVMRRVWDLGNVVQAGIRSLSKVEWEFLKRHDRRPVSAREIVENFDNALETILSGLSGRPLYITIDLDCLDPSVMPATGTPEPGGLAWYQLLKILRSVAGQSEVMGFDIVELAPAPCLHYPEFTAARLVYRMMGYLIT